VTTELNAKIPESIAVSDHYLFEKRLHKSCRGVLKENGNLYSMRYVCSNVLCPQFNRIVPLEEIVSVFEEVRRIDAEEPIKNDMIVKKEPSKQQLTISLLIGKRKVSIDTFWYRWFVYEIWKCLKCVHIHINWKIGIANPDCPKTSAGHQTCCFKEKWDL